MLFEKYEKYVKANPKINKYSRQLNCKEQITVSVEKIL